MPSNVAFRMFVSVHSTTTDSSGQYQFPSLPPSTYELTSRHGGLQTEIQKGLEVQVGETSTVDFHMAIAGATVQVEVSAEPLAIETSRGSQEFAHGAATVITRRTDHSSK